MITLLITLVILGFIVWLVTTYVPMNPPIKNIIVVVTVILALLIVLRAFGIADFPLR